jgi:hypothetical protein
MVREDRKMGPSGSLRPYYRGFGRDFLADWRRPSMIDLPSKLSQAASTTGQPEVDGLAQVRASIDPGIVADGGDLAASWQVLC